MARYILSADLHYRKNAPRSRLDDFFQSQVKKTEFILQQCVDNDAALLIAGDIFDGSIPSLEVISTYIALFKKYNVPIFVIAGNHDLRNHRMSSLYNTGLGILISTGVVTALNEKPLKYKGTNIYGANWEKEIPEIENEKDYNILLMHDMVIGDKLYDGQEIALEGNELIKKYKYNLIVSGHNHQSFVFEHNNKILCNPGSISRLNTTQTDFHPRIGLIDTRTQDFKWIDIPIQPSFEVFNLETIKQSKEKKLELSEFIISLKTKKAKPNFIVSLETNIKENKYTEEVISIIYEATGDSNDNK